VQARSQTELVETTFEMTQDDLARWRRSFQPPDADELVGTDVDEPPEGFESWPAWAAEWWPTSLAT
jgi:hypothetical protein